MPKTDGTKDRRTSRRSGITPQSSTSPSRLLTHKQPKPIIHDLTLLETPPSHVKTNLPPWKHPHELEYLRPIDWTDHQILSYLVKNAFSIPKRDTSRILVITSIDGVTTSLPSRYRSPLMFIANFQWESLRRILTCDRKEEEWNEHKFDLLHTARLCATLLEQARGAVQGKGWISVWKCPTFDRAMTRYSLRWMIQRESEVQDFFLKFGEAKYEKDVFEETKWNTWVLTVKLPYQLTKEQLSNGLSAKEFMQGIALDGSFLKGYDPETLAIVNEKVMPVTLGDVLTPSDCEMLKQVNLNVERRQSKEHKVAPSEPVERQSPAEKAHPHTTLISPSPIEISPIPPVAPDSEPTLVSREADTDSRSSPGGEADSYVEQRPISSTTQASSSYWRSRKDPFLAALKNYQQGQPPSTHEAVSAHIHSRLALSSPIEEINRKVTEASQPPNHYPPADLLGLAGRALCRLEPPWLPTFDFDLDKALAQPPEASGSRFSDLLSKDPSTAPRSPYWIRIPARPPISVYSHPNLSDTGNVSRSPQTLPTGLHTPDSQHIDRYMRDSPGASESSHPHQSSVSALGLDDDSMDTSNSDMNFSRRSSPTNPDSDKEDELMSSSPVRPIINNLHEDILIPDSDSGVAQSTSPHSHPVVRHPPPADDSHLRPPANLLPSPIMSPTSSPRPSLLPSVSADEIDAEPALAPSKTDVPASSADLQMADLSKSSIPPWKNSTAPFSKPLAETVGNSPMAVDGEVDTATETGSIVQNMGPSAAVNPPKPSAGVQTCDGVAKVEGFAQTDDVLEEVSLQQNQPEKEMISVGSGTETNIVDVGVQVEFSDDDDEDGMAGIEDEVDRIGKGDGEEDDVMPDSARQERRESKRPVFKVWSEDEELHSSPPATSRSTKDLTGEIQKLEEDMLLKQLVAKRQQLLLEAEIFELQASIKETKMQAETDELRQQLAMLRARPASSGADAPVLTHLRHNSQDVMDDTRSGTPFTEQEDYPLPPRSQRKFHPKPTVAS